MNTINTKEIIIQLKATQQERNLSISDIMNLLDEMKSPLGETTVRRVFKAGSEDVNFNYSTTIKPLVEALAVYGKGDAEAKLLLAANDYKDNLIEELRRQKEEMQKQFEQHRADYDKRMAFLRDQIELKDKRMDRKDVMIEKLLNKVLACGNCPVMEEK